MRMELCRMQITWFKWLEESFGHSSSLMAMIMLNKLESDVLTTEKSLLPIVTVI